MATDNPIRSIEDRLLVIETKVDHHTDRLGRLESHVDSRFNAIDNRLNSLETRVDARFNSIDNRLTSIENRLTLILVSTLAAVFAGFGGLIAAVFFR